MFHLIVSFVFLLVFYETHSVSNWNPTNFTFIPGENYQLVWEDEFENIGPIQAIIDGQPAYAPNPKNWVRRTGARLDENLENYTDSIYNSYVQNGQLTIVAMKDGYQSAELSSANLQEFTFGVFAAKIRSAYGKGIWPAWWLKGNDHQYGLTWPTSGEIDIVEMWGGSSTPNFTDQYAHGTVHWNNESNSMNPVYNQYVGNLWKTPDGSKLHENSLVYWTEWTPTNISIGVNEFTYFVINTTKMPDSINPVVAFSGLWPYYLRLDVAISDRKFYLIIQLFGHNK